MIDSSSSVLIIQTGFLGDAVLATGLVRSLREMISPERIGFVVRAGYADLFHNHPGITTLYPFYKKRRGGTKELISTLKERPYDVALIPHRSLRSTLIPFMAKIKTRVGFRQSDGSLLLSHRVEYDITSSEIERNASLLSYLSIVPNTKQKRGWLSPENSVRESIVRQYGSVGPVVLIAPGSVWGTKRWLPERYGTLVSELSKRGYTIYLVGSEQERELCLAIARRSGLTEQGVLAGTLSLKETAALCAMADRVVVNDSGMLHIAEAVGTSVTAIFGPTVPSFGFSPYLPDSALIESNGLPCRPCGIHGRKSCPLGTHDCMRGVSVEQVIATTAQSM